MNIPKKLGIRFGGISKPILFPRNISNLWYPWFTVSTPAVSAAASVPGAGYSFVESCANDNVLKKAGAVITEYVRQQGRKPEEYQKIYDEKQLKLFQTV
ncbi:MAG: hypothetical protein LBD31_05115 [Treponema sp.]|jgi:hypothetical protein|nr:hypothetical protein [Treponema sp.]